ncbi:MAG: C-type lectin domain-containing protein [Polyangiaceae bacterium]
MARAPLLLFVFLALAGCSPQFEQEPEAPIARPREVQRRRPVCAGVALASGGHDYCLMTESVTFAEAQSKCRATGLDLAKITSAEENFAVANALSNLGAGGGIHAFWIGLQKVGGSWQWPSGGGYTASPHLPWAANEPNNSGGSEDCGEYLIDPNQMNDLPCNQLRAFVCERIATEARTPFRCDGTPVMTRFGEYCIHKNPSTFMTAKEACAGAGETLADLSSPGEARELSRATSMPIATPSVWIGATDEDHEGEFRWSSGERLAYTGWGPGEPNNSGVENCAELIIATGRWNDVRCDAQRPPLCEAPSRTR